jgi:dolichol-phosphate mannosyltransferase
MTPASATSDGPGTLPAPTGRGVVVAVATYNEAENLPLLVEGLLRALPEATLVVVDDGSPDGTGDAADELARATGRVEVIHRPGKQGYASAFAAAFCRAEELGAEWVVSMDADLSHDPADVPRGLAALEESGADLAVGSRYICGGYTQGWPLHRRMLSKWGNAVFRWCLHVPVRDMSAGFRVYRPRALRVADFASVASQGYAALIETLLRCHDAGLMIAEFPIVFRERERGRSKMSLAIIAEQLRLLGALSLRRRRMRGGGKGST